MKLLLIAYKIEKGLGSEDGCGYNMMREMVKHGDEITLISRVNNIEKMRDDPAFKNTRLIGVDVPKPLSYVKKKGRGIIPYYYMWQWFVGNRVKKMQEHEQFDVIHQLNFHTDWAPHFLSNSKGKMVFGPLVHHAYVPMGFQFGNRWWFIPREFATRLAKWFFWYLDPFVKRAIARTDTIFYGNKDLAPPFKNHAHKIKYIPYGGSVFPPNREKDLEGLFNVLYVGRFVNLKGCIAAIDAFAKFAQRRKEGVHMTFVGKGELQQTMIYRARARGVEDQITFIPWIEQEDLLKHYQGAHVFLYPSFESQGLVVTEALSSGCPVICLDKTGPAFLSGEAGLTVPKGAYNDVVNSLYDRLEEVYTVFKEKAPYMDLVNKAVDRYEADITWEKIVARLRESYE